MSFPRLLPTKFIRPLLRSDLLERQHLLDRLDTAFQQRVRLTLISAPAGYGKTTLASAWLEQGIPHAWLMLDEADNDPARFFAALVAAVRQVEPTAGAGVQSLLEMPRLPSLLVLMEDLIADLSGVDQHFVLALDDYHILREPAVHEAVELLVTSGPPALHLLITSREDPPFPLGRLRAGGNLCEVRLRDLRFTREEEQRFLESRIEARLSPAVLDHLDRLTEGWAAGLQLAGLAIEGQPDASAWLEGLSGSHPYIIEYLLEEVLKHQPSEIQRFLRWTSILDRFNAELCDELVTGGGNGSSEPLDERDLVGRITASPHLPSAILLEKLEHENLFIIPLDPSRTWYRYHRLFADVLRAGLNPGEERILHRRAARWFEEHGVPAEAIHHNLLGGQLDEAVRLVRTQIEERMRYGELYTLRTWLSSLPVETLLAASDLAMLQALCLLLTGEMGAATSLIRQVELSGSENLTPSQSGRLLAIQVWLKMLTGGGREIAAPARQALSLLDPHDVMFRIMALLALGTGENWVGRLEESSQAFREAYELGRTLHHPFGELTALANLAFNLFHQGKLREALNLCLDAAARWVDSRGRPLPVVGMVYLPLCVFYLERNELEQAEKYARQAGELTRKIVSSQMLGGDSEQTLAEIAHARGDTRTALEIVNTTREFAAGQRITYLDFKMTLLAANFHLQNGDLERARHEAARLESLSGSLPNPQRSFIVLNARLALAGGRPAEALELLRDPEDSARAGRNGMLVGVLALKAAVLLALGRADQAGALIEEAVCLAAPEGFRRSILRQGPMVAPLVARARPVAPEFVDSLLAVWGDNAVSEPDKQPGLQGQDNQKSAIKNQQLPEPLSEQEQRVLRLLAAGRSNAEIAAELYIGLGTAKWHVHNILGKLGVSSRAEAIVRARELGLA